MNVFVLCTGRCGSVTFIRACSHISNYTAAHESRTNCIGDERLNYPPNHIEADNRLSWFLGRLEATYGNDAFYVHLKRNPTDVARSFLRRYNVHIMKAYRDGILLGNTRHLSPFDLCLDYCETVNSNVSMFLRDKSRQFVMHLETAVEQFPEFWRAIGASGDVTAALREWTVRHNASADPHGHSTVLQHRFRRVVRRTRKWLRAHLSRGLGRVTR